MKVESGAPSERRKIVWFFKKTPKTDKTKPPVLNDSASADEPTLCLTEGKRVAPAPGDKAKISQAGSNDIEEENKQGNWADSGEDHDAKNKVAVIDAQKDSSWEAKKRKRFEKKQWLETCKKYNISTVEELKEVNDRREQEILDMVYGEGAHTVGEPSTRKQTG